MLCKLSSTSNLTSEISIFILKQSINYVIKWIMLWLSHWKNLLKVVIFSFKDTGNVIIQESKSPHPSTGFMKSRLHSLPFSVGTHQSYLVLFSSVIIPCYGKQINYKCKLLSYKNSFSQDLVQVGPYLYTIERLSKTLASVPVDQLVVL